MHSFISLKTPQMMRGFLVKLLHFITCDADAGDGADDDDDAFCGAPCDADLWIFLVPL
jgi:hypothetical protein